MIPSSMWSASINGFFFVVRAGQRRFFKIMASSSTQLQQDLSDDEQSDPFVALENVIIAYNLARQKKASAKLDNTDLQHENPPKRQRNENMRTSIRFSNVDKAGAASFFKQNIPAGDNHEPVLDSKVSTKYMKYAGIEHQSPVDTQAQESTIFYYYLLLHSARLFFIRCRRTV
jgi:hypothetical protein